MSKRKDNISTAKKYAWEAFSRFIRLRDSLKTMHNNFQCKCISCEAIKDTLGRKCIQAGHFIPGRGGSILFDEEIVNGQCYNCNYNLKGNWVEYERVMIARFGAEKVEEFKRRKDLSVHYSKQDYIDIEQKYLQKIVDLGGFAS